MRALSTGMCRSSFRGPQSSVPGLRRLARCECVDKQQWDRLWAPVREKNLEQMQILILLNFELEYIFSGTTA